MGIPQIILIVIYAVSVGYSVANHGKQRGRYNLWDTLIGGGIELLILYWGGFFG